jgi:hypothetical protein
MTRDDIIRMAREVGMEPDDDDVIWWLNTADLERFAALIAAAEREACAKVVEASPSYDWHRFACEAAAAIRARKNT